MHAAFIEGDLEALRRELVPLGDFPNASPDVTIGPPLVYAIYNSPLTLVHELLDADADPTVEDGDGFPPIIAALTCATSAPGAPGRDDVHELVELLLERGADPNQHGINDDTPLHIATALGDLPLVDLLLRHGADPNEITRIDEVETPLELAERTGKVAIADRLRPLTTRVDWERATRDGELRVLRRMLRDGHDIDATDGYGLTALMRAAHNGHSDVVEWLIAEGADLDHTSKFHLSALMLAVIAKHQKVARMLVRAGAARTITGTGAPGFAGKTAAELAEEAGNPRLAAYIRNHR
jgi:ankyrin repeat protein